MTPSPAIEVRDIFKTYHDGLIFRRPFQALKGVTLHVDHGEIFGLLGPNGAGKTTLVKLLLGIVRKTHGHATLLGRPAGDRGGRRRIGYLPENLRIPRHLTAHTALDLYGQLSGLSGVDIKRRRGDLLESVGLADRAKDGVKKYSKGMVQRLGLAIALLHDPELVFMDEPTDGLDPRGRADVRQALLRLKSEGKTIFLNSHLLQEVEMVCDRVAILDEGILKGIGTVEQLVPNRPDGVQLEMAVVGSEKALLQALAPITDYRTTAAAEGTVELAVRLSDQIEVDQCVDALRNEGISIVSMQRKRISLEDAFLEVLSPTEESP